METSDKNIVHDSYGMPVCTSCNRIEGFCICEADKPELTVEMLLDRTYEQMVLFERRLDAQEELIANMMLAYSQITATLETLITEVMAPRSEEEKREFKADMKRRHLDLMNLIQESTRGVERSGPDTGPPVEHLAESDDATPSES